MQDASSLTSHEEAEAVVMMRPCAQMLHWLFAVSLESLVEFGAELRKEVTRRLVHVGETRCRDALQQVSWCSDAASCGRMRSCLGRGLTPDCADESKVVEELLLLRYGHGIG